MILIFRLSDLGAANTFWTDFNDGDLKAVIRRKLESFSDEKNCFKNEDILFDIVIDEEDFKKVHHTLENPDECKLCTRTVYMEERLPLKMCNRVWRDLKPLAGFWWVVLNPLLVVN